MRNLTFSKVRMHTSSRIVVLRNFMQVERIHRYSNMTISNGNPVHNTIALHPAYGTDTLRDSEAKLAFKFCCYNFWRGISLNPNAS